MIIHKDNFYSEVLPLAFNKHLLVVIALSFLLITPVIDSNIIKATELSPSDQIKPSRSEPTMDSLPDRADLTHEESELQQDDCSVSSSKPSWWNWLISASKKPANYHFIDIIELLS